MQTLLQSLNFHLDYPTLNVILPVGISFYTFQALSYSIDVYWNKINPTKDALAFFAFVCFFPQLVAGPIERATNLLPQFQRNRTFDYSVAVDGCRQMLWGFFKKVVIADNCARYANIAFGNYNEVGSMSLLLGAFFFTFQIYGDFSGYSSIAIGCAKLFGIKLQPNFRVPYFSRDIAEFWKRWHISLNKWFVDYVYIPLGGSRVSKIKVIRNIFTIFLLSGLWHGANWTYVVWGLYHACLFLPLILLNKNHKYSGGFCEDKNFPSLHEAFNMLGTFLLVMIGWIIFRATSLTQALEYITKLCSFEKRTGEIGIAFVDSLWLIGIIMVALLFEWWNRNADHEFKRIIPKPLVRNLVYFILIASIYVSYMMTIEDDTTFIYFQF
jgi:D-alanyl-lipoteichoic acid acyltransferase DltB (MBOAT superfamily)